LEPLNRFQEAKIVFDVYYGSMENDYNYKSIDVFAVPRIENMNNSKGFNVFVSTWGSGDRISKNYRRIAEGVSGLEANDEIDNLIDKNPVEPNGLSGYSATYTYIDWCFLENKLISCLFSWFSDGGAHPANGKKAINYDLASNKEITLKDIISNEEEVISYLYENQGLRSEEECKKVLVESCFGCSREELYPQGFFFNEKKITILVMPHRLNSYCSGSLDLPFEKINEGRLKSFLRTNNLKDEGSGR
jgi:hypothetical protein